MYRLGPIEVKCARSRLTVSILEDATKVFDEEAPFFLGLDILSDTRAVLDSDAGIST